MDDERYWVYAFQLGMLRQNQKDESTFDLISQIRKNQQLEEKEK